jgi:transcriptional regulator with XRE-family HTH domain
MVAQKAPQVTKAVIAAARKRAQKTRGILADNPQPSQLLTPQELDDAAPFYFVLREYIRQLKEAREAAGLTLADVSARTGMAVEYLSRLETGAQTNPTWKTLGTYTKALNLRPQLTLDQVSQTNSVAVSRREMPPGAQYVREKHGNSASILIPEQSLQVA